MIILASDPGWGSGISWYDTDTGDFNTEEVHEFIPACQRFYALLDTFHKMGDVVEVVAEGFVITQKTAQLSGQNESLRLNGVLEWLCFNYGYKFSLQMPGARKPGEMKIKVLNWSRKTKDKHSDSASGHLLVYLLKHGLLRDEEKRKLLESL